MDIKGKDATTGNKRGCPEEEGNDSTHHAQICVPAEGDPTAADNANTLPKQSKHLDASSVAPVDLPNGALSLDELRRAEEEMRNVLLCQAVSEQVKYNISSSNDEDYPGDQTTSTKLSGDHHKTPCRLPVLLSFGKEVLSSYYCPCPASMKLW